jgi:hypothetical protein
MARTSSPTGSGTTKTPDTTIDLSSTEGTIPAPRPLAEISGGVEAVALARTGGAPTLTPPSAAGVTDVSAVAVGGVTGTWTSGVKVNALWSQYATRNAYMSVAGVGWVKIYNGSDGSFLNLTTLASQAKQTQSSINYRTEADGMVHEIYLW